MPLSKLWLFILSFVCGMLALLLLSLDPELRRREVDEQTQRLQRAQAVATQLLANQAHKLVAAAVQMSSDAVLQVSLAEMGRGHSELPLLHHTAQAQLKQLNRDFAAALVLCTDAKGRVLARIGHDEAVYRDPLDGFPLVESALRGYRLDDLWLLDGVLYRVAAAPVVAPGRDRYVGALVVGQVVGSELIDSLSRMTGVSALFIADGKIVASQLQGMPPDVAQLLSTRSLKGGPVIRIAQSGADRLFAFVDMPGAAAQQGALLVLAGEVTGTRTLPGLIRDTVQGLRPTQAALGLFGAVVMLYVIGLAILRAERAQLHYRIARSLTARTVAAPVPAHPPSSPRLAGSNAAVSGGASAHSAETGVAGPILWEPEPEPEAQHLPPPLPERSADAVPPARPPAAPVSSVPPVPLVPPPARPPLPAVAPPPPATLSPAATAPDDYELPPPNSNFEPTLVAGPAAAAAGNDADASFYQVFQEYVLTRERCHESVEGISYEQFRQRLQESRAQIMQQHNCRGVDFQVYIKEGRAALRATPLWK